MLGADVIVVEAVGFFTRKRQDLLGSRRKIIHCFAARNRTVLRLPRHFTNIRLREDFQTLADNLRAQMVAFFRIQLLLRALLQMGGLRFDEELVDGQTSIFRESAQIDAELHD